MKTARTFPPDAESITAARRFVLTAIGAVTRDLRDAVSVMVSELAMNAVQHARTPFEVTVEVTDRTLRVEVTDSGGGTAQAQPPSPATSLHGRGLFIVDQLCDAWGVNPAAPGPSKSIWFTIALTATADSSPRRSAVTEPARSAGTPANPPAQQSPNPRMHCPQPEHGPRPDQKGRRGHMLASQLLIGARCRDQKSAL
jgi:anti-sigma regulatory factor (Ser/Thr protein kinase)